MRESFFGLNVALAGLYSSQRGLDIVNHNLANVNTEGYSRQEAVQNASRPLPVLDGTGMVGTGSEITEIKRVRDVYLDYKYWSENYMYGEWEAKTSMLSDIEVTFNEPSDSGFNKITDEFYSAMQELQKDPSSMSARALFREKAVSFAKYFNTVAGHFEKIQYDINYNIRTKVEELNSLATQIAQLNRQIYAAELDGNKANDLRDQRTVLLDKLSSIINVDASEIVTGILPNGKEDKKFIVNIGGKSLVDGNKVCKVRLTQRSSDEMLNPDEDIPNLFKIDWEDGNELYLIGGQLKGYFDVRDGNDGLNGSPNFKGIPYYIRKLNEFARTYVKALNEGILDINGDGIKEDSIGHADGYTLDSTASDPKTGIRLFTIINEKRQAISSQDFQNLGATTDEIYNFVKAKNLTVSKDILDNLNNICTSDVPGSIGNSNIMKNMLEMRHNPHMFIEGAPEDFIKSVVTTIGIDSQQAQRISSNQRIIVKQIETRRMSESGVSIDEEMTNLVKFQHAYNASAKMIATLQSVYETLVNKLGVG